MKLAEMFAEEPEPLNENDPAVQHELFEIFFAGGTEPQEVKDRKLRRLYAAWVAKRFRGIPHGS